MLEQVDSDLVHRYPPQDQRAFPTNVEETGAARFDAPLAVRPAIIAGRDQHHNMDITVRARIAVVVLIKLTDIQRYAGPDGAPYELGSGRLLLTARRG